MQPPNIESLMVPPPPISKLLRGPCGPQLQTPVSVLLSFAQVSGFFYVPWVSPQDSRTTG